MTKKRRAVVRPMTASAVDAAELRRHLARRFVLPVIVATLFAAAQTEILRASAQMDKPSPATLGPILNAPAFVRPPRPSPDALFGHGVRLATTAPGATADDHSRGLVVGAPLDFVFSCPPGRGDHVSRKVLET